jgi:elongation factor P
MPLRSLAAAANLAREAPNSGPSVFQDRRQPGAGFVVKVIASDVRKGNVLEHEDGKLYVVLSHETFRPGKGTPTTTIVMRRIIDGVKTTAVHKTTDGLEKAFVEQIKHTFLFDDGDAGLVFMNPTSYEQVHLSKDMVGDSVAYLQPEMVVDLTMFEGQALSIELPPRITATIDTTEPVVKGQTASSSYKPAMLDIGVKTMVLPGDIAHFRALNAIRQGVRGP